MRADLLPLCDQHFRAMELCIAPHTAQYSIEYFRCTEKFCGRCFSERVGYVLPKRGVEPVVAPGQPRCELHGLPMFIASLDRQRNTVRYACSEHGCEFTLTRG